MPNDGTWTRTDIERPPKGLAVDTKVHTAAGVSNEQRMYKDGNLWWHADGSMYVYYTPTHWKR